MRFHNVPKHNLQDKNQYESSVEIKPDWKKAGLITLVIISLYVAIISAQYTFQANKALADELLYHHLEREFPRPGRLVYIPLGDCLHLARYDPDTGYFYDDIGWLGADKWLYVTDRWPAEVETCTAEDLENAPRLP